MQRNKAQAIAVLPNCGCVPLAALGDATNGDVPESALDQQIQIMNSLMSNTPFTFVNAGVTRVSNTSVRLQPLANEGLRMFVLATLRLFCAPLM
jgi:hypothetical protein